MWPASLITAGAAAFGRLFATGILPSTVLTAVLWLTVSSHAFDGNVSNLSLHDVVIRSVSSVSNSNTLFLLLLIIAGLTAVLRNFHVPILRPSSDMKDDGKSSTTTRQ